MYGQGRNGGKKVVTGGSPKYLPLGKALLVMQLGVDALPLLHLGRVNHDQFDCTIPRHAQGTLEFLTLVSLIVQLEC